MGNEREQESELGRILAAFSAEKELDRAMFLQGLREILRELRPLLEVLKTKLGLESTGGPENGEQTEQIPSKPAYKLVPMVQKELFPPLEPSDLSPVVEPGPSSERASSPLVASFDAIPSPPVSERIRPKKAAKGNTKEVKPPKSRQAWTPAAVELLKALVQQAKDDKKRPNMAAIAAALGRSRDSVATLISKLKHGKWRGHKLKD